VPDILAELRRELSTAYRIVANEGILDAFGHISVRHPENRSAISCRARARPRWSSRTTFWSTISTPTRSCRR
jgi:hypothetical protein